MPNDLAQSVAGLIERQFGIPAWAISGPPANAQHQDPLPRLNREKPWRENDGVHCANCAGEPGHDCPLCEGRGWFEEQPAA